MRTRCSRSAHHKERNNNEFTHSVQKNSNSATSDRTGDRHDCGAAAAGIGAELRDGAGGGL
jgi:hypothetical protein